MAESDNNTQSQSSDQILSQLSEIASALGGGGQQSPFSGITIWNGDYNQIPLAGNENPNVTGGATQNAPVKLPLEELANKSLSSMSPAQMADLQQQLVQAGYLPSTFNASGEVDLDTAQAFGALLNDVHLYTDEFGGGLITWQDYLAGKVQGADGEGNANDPYAPHTSSTVSVSTGQDAYGAAENVFQQMLGRDPDEKDVKALHAALNAYEQAHPRVTTSQTDRRGNTTSTTSGGAGEGYGDALAEQRVTDNYGGEAAQVQIQRLAGVFEQMLGGG
jgi:hypothetical protein